jgi:hypothetical protein
MVICVKKANSMKTRSILMKLYTDTTDTKQ